jgi:small subunit ribosomal protein S17
MVNSSPTPTDSGRQHVLHGVVVARSGDKTVSVVVTRTMRHPKYGKKIVRTKKYLTHDPDNAMAVGDQVTIKLTRPLSARKRWIVVRSK